MNRLILALCIIWLADIAETLLLKLGLRSMEAGAGGRAARSGDEGLVLSPPVKREFSWFTCIHFLLCVKNAMRTVETFTIALDFARLAFIAEGVSTKQFAWLSYKFIERAAAVTISAMKFKITLLPSFTYSICLSKVLACLQHKAYRIYTFSSTRERVVFSGCSSSAMARRIMAKRSLSGLVSATGCWFGSRCFSSCPGVRQGSFPRVQEW